MNIAALTSADGYFEDFEVGALIRHARGKTVTEMDMALWTDGKMNPDGSEIPSWMPRPFATLATKGKIGLQGKHAGAPIFFRNVRINKAKA